MNFLIFGGTKRAEILFSKLSERGHSGDYIDSIESFRYDTKYDLIILPVPTLDRDGFINIPSAKKVKPEEIFCYQNEKTLIISCNYNDERFNIVDLNQREDFTYLNAVPTAEGAISIAINSSEISLTNSKIAITGYGHVGKILADKLKGLGCDITVIARSDYDIYLAKAQGFKTKLTSALNEHANNYDIIFQTIPARVLNSDVLNTLNQKTKIIELSSRGFGTDMDYAKSAGIDLIFAPALPEKTAPITAGNILYECVENILNEQKIGV